MIEHVYRRASAARSVSSVIVATDDERIARGAGVRRHRAMTSPRHPSGTDRLAEVAAARCDLVVNVQGDEPLIEPAMIDDAVAPFAADPALQMSTLRRASTTRPRSRTPTSRRSSSIATATRSIFSRAPIPVRAGRRPAPPWRHVGLYVYRRDVPAAARGAAADRRSNAPRRWSSCARSSTAFASRRSRPRTTRSASTRRRSRARVRQLGRGRRGRLRRRNAEQQCP